MSIQSIYSAPNYSYSSFSAYLSLTSQQTKIAILAIGIFSYLIGIYIHSQFVIKNLENTINNLQGKWVDLHARIVKVEANKLPEAQINELAEAKVNELAEAKVNELVAAKVNELTEAKVNELAGAKINELAEAKANEVCNVALADLRVKVGRIDELMN